MHPDVMPYHRRTPCTHTFTHTFILAQLPAAMFLGDGKTLENPEEINKYTRRRCKTPHRQSPDARIKPRTTALLYFSLPILLWLRYYMKCLQTRLYHIINDFFKKEQNILNSVQFETMTRHIQYYFLNSLNL